MAESATVHLELKSKPECISLVRGMLAGVAEPLALSSELLDDLKTAVSEACNNVVLHAYDGKPGRLAVSLAARRGAVQVVVRDWGNGIRHVTPAEDRMHVGLALISALASRAEFLSGSDGGTEVRMAFNGAEAEETDGNGFGSVEIEEKLRESISGDVVVTLTPIALLGGVLGRLARALAAGSRFTLDRFSDLYLVTDALAAHAGSSAGSQISFAVTAGPRRVEIALGPFEAGANGERQSGSTEPESVLSLLTDELNVEPVNHHELLRLVMQDRRAPEDDAAEES